MTYKVSVVIPTCKNVYLHHTLNSLQYQKGFGEDDYEVIVVENPKAVKKNQNMVEECGPNFKYIVSNEAGSNKARNYGIEAASSKYIAITDDDVVVTPGWLSQVVNVHGMFPEVGCFGGPLLLTFRNKDDEEIDQPMWIHGWLRNLLSETYFDIGQTMPFDIYDKAGFWLVSANLSFKKRIWETVGGFKEDIGYHGRKVYMSNDELEFVDACGNYGAPNVLYVPQMKLFHQIPPSRQTVEFFEHKAYGQGFSDGEMWKREDPTSSMVDIYHNKAQHQAQQFMPPEMVAGIRDYVGNEAATRVFIGVFIRAKLAYMNGVINSLEEKEIWKNVS